ncbi:MAG: hypothetical protein ACK502_07425 [Alphaproteobacteria bacterium]
MKNFAKTFFTLMVTTASMLPVTSMAETLATGEDESLSFSVAVNDAELDTYRGTFNNVTLLSSNLSANLQGNSSSNNVSGANSISEGALNNVAGLTSVIQNSGNNVIIQQATTVNVNFLQ